MLYPVLSISFTGTSRVIHACSDLFHVGGFLFSVSMKNLTTSPVAQSWVWALCTLQLIVLIMLTTLRTRFIHHILNLQQQNASQTRTNFLADLPEELEASWLDVEYLTWYGVVNVASAWHATWRSNSRVFSEKVQGNF